MKKTRLFIVFCFHLTLLKSQSVPFQRVATLGKGMALSWLERYWLGDPYRNFADYFDVNGIQNRKNDLLVMKQMGNKTLRLPVWFTGWYSTSSTNPTVLTPQYFTAVDSFVRWTNDLDMNIIIDYHLGELNRQNLSTETVRIANIWKSIAARYATSNPNRVFFEIYNEPYDLTSAEWKNAANSIVASIRTVAPAHTLIVGGTQYNDINYLDSLGTLRDNNIIYTFHFYEPFIFTHQGATWVENGLPMATTGIPFPYNGATMPTMNPLAKNTWGESSYQYYNINGTVEAINNQLRVAYLWQTAKQRPVYCGEFGSDALYGDVASRCRLLKTIRQTLEAWKIPFAWWDWDGGFKMFTGNTPSVSALPECFVDAWGMTTIPPPPSTGNDLSVDLSANVAAYQPYTSIIYKLVVTNKGTTAFSNINIAFPFPPNMVNDGSVNSSIGKWSEVCSGGIKCYTWAIPTLVANTSADLTLSLFNLNTTQPITGVAKLLSSTPADVQTNNNQSILKLNRVAQNAASIVKKPTQRIPVVIQSIYPSITEGDMMVRLESIVEREIPFFIINSLGKTIKTMVQKIDKGTNRFSLDVCDLPQGVYFITPDGSKAKQVPTKFVKM